MNEACERLESVEADGYRPKCARASTWAAAQDRRRLSRRRRQHRGAVADGASAGEILVSDRALRALESADVKAKRKRLFRAKGVPDEVTVYAVKT